MDKVDMILDRLNAAIPEVPFQRDAMDEDTPDDWGAVEVRGGTNARADGHTVDVTYGASVWICVGDRETGIIERVEAVLDEIEEDEWINWRMAERNYLYDLNRIAYRYDLSIPGPLEMPEEEDDG